MAEFPPWDHEGVVRHPAILEIGGIMISFDIDMGFDVVSVIASGQK